MVYRQILIIFALIMANGIFAMAEAAVISARKARLQERVNAGDKRAAAALELANAPNRFLSTTQFGITLIGILAGAFGGATLTDDLAEWLSGFAALAPYSHSLALAVVVGTITLVSLIIGELVPKRLALNNPESVASAIAGPMQRLSAIASPIVFVLGAATDALLHALGQRRADASPVSEEEVKILIEEGAAAGVFHAMEHQIVKSVFRLGDLRVNEMMVPRLQIAWLDVNDPLEANLRKMAAATRSRFPLADGDMDHFIGIVSVRAAWEQQRAGEPPDLAAVAVTPPFLPESLPALQALEVLRHSPSEMAVVVGEYGDMQGIITLTDVLEGIVGDLPGAPAVAEKPAVHCEDGSWLLDGMLLPDDVKELLDIRGLPGEDDRDYDTLGGFMMDRLQRLPTTGSAFDWHGYHWEVASMDGRRVSKVIVRPGNAA